MPIEAVSCSRKAVCSSVKWLERRQLDHRLDLALEQDRQHDDALGRGLEQARADRMERRRHVGDQDLAAVGGALADQALADPDRLGMARAAVGIDREQAQPASPSSSFSVW